MNTPPNKDKIHINPFTGDPDVVFDPEGGITIKKQISGSITVKSGYTKLHPNMIVPVGKTVTIEDDAELIA